MSTFYRSPGSYTVRVGSTEKSRGGVVYRVQSYRRHANFDRATIDWDYALLQLDQSIQFNRATKPIRLIGAQQRVEDGTMALISGWGTTQSAEPNSILHGAEVPIVNQQVCVNAYRRTGTVTPRMLCAGLLDRGGKDSCQG